MYKVFREPTVSVLMPVRNGTLFIDESIASVVAQSFQDWELVVVDDGSTDDTLAKLRMWQARDSRIVVISIPPSGLVAASNTAISASRGRYLARLDSDDICHRWRLQLQVAYMDLRPELVVVGSSILLRGDRFGFLSVPWTNWGCKGRLLFENCFAHSSTMIRRSHIEGVFPLYVAQSDYAEDMALWIKLLSCGDFGNIPFPLVSYRIHAQQVSRNRAMDLRLKHANFVVGRWAEYGVVASSEDFVRLRWPEAGVSRLELLRHTFSMLRKLSPILSTRYGVQAICWGGGVLFRNVLKIIFPGVRRYF